jgi:alanine-glyoxylate transaminase/serine-glyoxylate transaminase/serine-pyruvate transaminase
MPEGHDADRFRAAALEGWDISLGSGLGRLQGRVFRIGHLGDFNDLMLMGTLAGVELGLRATDVPFKASGLAAAIDVLSRPQNAASASRCAASA